MENNNIIEQLTLELESGVIARIYKETYESLINRMKDNGYLMESLTGAYIGEFCRTIGAYVSLLLETKDYARIKKSLEFVFDSMIRNNLNKVPHVFGDVEYFEDGSFKQMVDDIDQIDGRAHVVLAYSRYCLTVDEKEFENKYYNIARTEMLSFLNQPYFYYYPLNINWPSTDLGLVLNCCFEHSREGRFWTTFDILTQSFVGAAAEAMIKLAKRRKDYKFSEEIEKKLEVLKISIDKYMTRQVDGKKVYLEMRTPDGKWGQEFTAMGGFCYAPIAAQWEALDRQVLRDTIGLLKEKLYIQDSKSDIRITCHEYDLDGNISYSVIGKCMGWDIDFCRQEKQYDKILDWCRFLQKYHSDKEILAEQINLVDNEWVKADCGNGEQCAWWCFAIARLRKELGLPGLPN